MPFFWCFIILLYQTYLLLLLELGCLNFFRCCIRQLQLQTLLTQKQVTLQFFLPLFILCLFILFLIHNVIWYVTLSADSYQNLRNVVLKVGYSYLRSYVLFNVFSNFEKNDNCCQLLDTYKIPLGILLMLTNILNDRLN